MSTAHEPKRQRVSSPASSAPYELIYWPSIPGRAEPIRLAFEAAQVAYTDVSNATHSADTVLSLIAGDNGGSDGNPPAFAPPMLRHGSLLLSQTANILAYLGPRLGLVPDAADDPHGMHHVQALALTALDGFCNEAHDTHHPLGPSLYYDDQKDAARRRAADYVRLRLPKFLAYFERVLAGRASRGGDWLYGGRLSYADLVLFQTLDGVAHAFPHAVRRLRHGAEFGRVWALVERVGGLPAVKDYLASERRLKYGNGIWRHYPELDEQGEE